MGNGFQKKDKVLFFVAVIALLSLVVTIVSQKSSHKTLPVYNEENTRESVVATPQPTKPVFEAQIYTNESPTFSLSVPKDWEKVTKSGYTTFVHKQTGASVQIRIKDYDPLVNSDDADGLSRAITDSGKTFMNYTKLSTSSYEVLYQDKGASTFDYIDEVYWDRKNMITLEFIVDDKYYMDLKDTISTIISSFVWQREMPIPEDFYLAYFPDGFELALPDAWTASLQGESLYAYDPQTGASLTYSIGGPTKDLSSISANELIANMQGPNMAGFFLEYYKSDATSSVATANYTIDGQKYHMQYYIFSDGVASYHLFFDYADGVDIGNVPQTCAALFRSFRTPAENSQDVSGNNTENNTDNNTENNTDNNGENNGE